jgi:alpha-mannosidase
MKRLIERDQLEIGASFVDRIEHSHGGESIIRHAVEGTRWLDETFGPGTRTAAHPDLPGLSPQVPQIYAQAGITSYLHARGVGCVSQWVAPDGSSITYCNLFGYGEKKPEEYQRVFQKPNLPSAFIVRGGYSDLRDCSDTVLGVVEALRHPYPDMQISFASPARIISRVQNQVLPQMRGEMPFGWGSLSSGFATLMKQSAELEHSLLTLEKITALASAAGVSPSAAQQKNLATGKQYWKLHKGIESDIFGERIQEGRELRELWRYELVCQDHNYAGRHGAQSNWDKEVWREHALQEVALRIDNGLRSFAPPAAVDSLVLFNPVSWPRDEVLIIPDKKPETLQVLSADGNALPSQPVSQGLAIQVDQLPPLGTQTYSLLRGKAQASNYSSGTHLAGDGIEVDVDESTGQITRLYDRAIGHDLLGASTGRGLGELMSYKDPGVDVIYSFTGEVESDSDVNYRIVRNEDGPVFARITLSGTFLNSQIEKEYTVYKKSRRVDVALRVWWWGKRGEHLRLRFPFTKDLWTNTWYGVPFYSMCWPEMLQGDDAFAQSILGQEDTFSDMLRQDDRHHFREVIGWLDVVYATHGVGIGTQSTCWWISDSELQASLLRTQYSCGDTDLWNLNTGFHEWKFRVEPHEGDWREGKVYRKGEETLNPPAMMRTGDKSENPSITGATPKLEPVQVQPQNVIVTALKPSDLTEGGFVVRVLECEGQAADVSLRFPFPVRKVDLVDLGERETSQCIVSDQSVSFSLRPYQFQTVKVIPG